jgi:hypothetical protein
MEWWNNGIRKAGKGEAPAEFAEKGLVCFFQSREGPIG